MTMETFGIFGAFFGIILIVLGIVWTVFCVVLFIKVWGMCNDVKEILQILKRREFKQ